MKIFFVHSSNHEDLLREARIKLLVCYPYMRDRSKIRPDIPGGFDEVIVDSGGFQLATGVAEVYLKGYSMWLEFLLPEHPEIVGYFTLDVIGDPVKTMQNFVYMKSQGLDPIPVWHDGSEVRFLDYYAERYPWISIGGLVSGGGGKKYLARLNNWLIQRYPDTKFHLFGIGISGILAFQQMRPYSCDFSTWSTVSRFGHAIVLDDKQIIKEVQMPKEDRDRLRVDKAYEKECTRMAINNIQHFEDKVNELEAQGTAYQKILF